jgi:hypothetical protein
MGTETPRNPTRGPESPSKVPATFSWRSPLSASEAERVPADLTNARRAPLRGQIRRWIVKSRDRTRYGRARNRYPGVDVRIVMVPQLSGIEQRPVNRLVAGSNPARGAKQAPEKPSLFRSLLFPSSGKKSDLASTLQAHFPHLSVQSCKVSCKVIGAEMGRTMRSGPSEAHRIAALAGLEKGESWGKTAKWCARREGA